MLFEDIIFISNNESIDENIKFNNVIYKYSRTKLNLSLYDEINIYIPIPLKYDIIFNITNILYNNYDTYYKNNEYNKIEYNETSINEYNETSRNKYNETSKNEYNETIKIIKIELCDGCSSAMMDGPENIFNKICDIELNKDFNLPVYLIPFSSLFFKLTFDNIQVNGITDNIQITYTTGNLQPQYRKNIIAPIEYPLSHLINENGYMENKESINTSSFNDTFNIITKTNEYQFINKSKSIYKLLTKYDCPVKLFFGNNVCIDTNLLNIDLIPCIILYADVILINKSNLPFNLSFKIINYSQNEFIFIIDNKNITLKIKN